MASGGTRPPEACRPVRMSSKAIAVSLGGARMAAMEEDGQLLARALARRPDGRLEQIVLYVRRQLAPNLGGRLSKSGHELVRSHSITSSAGGRTMSDYHRFSGGSASSTRIDKGGATSSNGRHSAPTPSRRVTRAATIIRTAPSP